MERINVLDIAPIVAVLDVNYTYTTTAYKDRLRTPLHYNIQLLF